MDNFTVETPLPATGSREDLYATMRTMKPTPALVDDETLKADGGTLACKSKMQRWEKFSVTYEDFTAVGVSESIVLFSLVAGGMVERVVVDVTEAWVIAGMSALDLTLGIVGTTDKYTPSAHANGEAVGTTGFSAVANLAPESMSSATNILLTATSNAGNLVTASAGAADIYVLRGDLINI